MRGFALLRVLHAVFASLKCSALSLLLLFCAIANFAAGTTPPEPFFLVAWPVPHAVIESVLILQYARFCLFQPHIARFLVMFLS